MLLKLRYDEPVSNDAFKFNLGFIGSTCTASTVGCRFLTMRRQFVSPSSVYPPYTPPTHPLHTPYTPPIHPLYTPYTPPIHPLYTPY